MKPEECTTIEQVRHEIDLIDRQIIELFSERFKYAKAIVKFKNNEQEVIAIERKNMVIEQRAQWAAELGLDAETFKRIYDTLITSNIKKELDLLNSKNKI